jgi:hypothetical protein
MSRTAHRSFDELQSSMPTLKQVRRLNDFSQKYTFEGIDFVKK